MNAPTPNATLTVTLKDGQTTVSFPPDPSLCQFMLQEGHRVIQSELAKMGRTDSAPTLQLAGPDFVRQVEATRPRH